MELIIIIYFAVVFTFGLVVGSFLNCVVYRLEKEEKLTGRSYCPHCNHQLAWQDLIPVFSYLFLKGSCRYCHKKISIQYPLIEILTGFVFLLIFTYGIQQSVFELNSLQFLSLMPLFYIASSLIVIFVYDLKHYLIPDVVLYMAIVVMALYRLLEFGFSVQILGFLWAVLIALGFFLSIYMVSRGQWMGFGDVKLAILLGLILGFPLILVGIFLAFLFGAIIGGGFILFGKKGLKSQVPFAPFLIIGTVAALIWGEPLLSWYIALFLL